ncbi:MAG: hypothetical protein IJS67_00645 [Clostridia bacterium]|nr:hypothetical protein [Clostridia bacterium]
MEENKKIDFDSLDFSEIASSGKGGTKGKTAKEIPDLPEFQSSETGSGGEYSYSEPRSTKDNVLTTFAVIFAMAAFWINPTVDNILITYFRVGIPEGILWILAYLSTFITSAVPILIFGRSTKLFRFPDILHVIFCFLAVLFFADTGHSVTFVQIIFRAVLFITYFVFAFMYAFGIKNGVTVWGKRIILMIVILFSIITISKGSIYWLYVSAAALFASFINNEND